MTGNVFRIGFGRVDSGTVKKKPRVPYLVSLIMAIHETVQEYLHLITALVKNLFAFLLFYRRRTKELNAKIFNEE